MSQRGVRFVEGWVSKNVYPGEYEPVGDLSEICQLAEQCFAIAAAEGISREEIEEDLGSVHDFISAAVESQMEEGARMPPRADHPRVDHDAGQMPWSPHRRWPVQQNNGTTKPRYEKH
jgi:hypothetical protein